MCLLAACRGFNCTLTRAIGWPQFALQHHWLLPINCHFLRLYCAAGRGIAAASSAIEESDLYLLTFLSLIPSTCGPKVLLPNVLREGILITSHPVGGAKYCDQRVSVTSVCLSVCPLAYLKKRLNFTTFSVHVICGRGSVFL